MKSNQILITLILLTLLFSLGIVSAERTVNNTVFYGVVEDNGSLTISNTQLTDTQNVGFYCINNQCSSINGLNFFSNQPVNISGSTALYTFPTILQENGYGIYVYKEGYVPYEIFSNLAGTSATDPIQFSSYLTKQRTCSVPISNLSISENSGNVSINLDVLSPIFHSGNLDYVPPQIISHYSTDVNISVNITNSSGFQIYQKELIKNIEFSGKKNTAFNLQLPAEDYLISIDAYSQDDKCLSSTISNVVSNLTVNDTKAPNSVDGLTLVSKTKNVLSWAWNNPLTDFFEAIIFLDGVNVLNTTLNSYDATGLIPNTTHTIIIHTKDYSGNINDTDILDVNTTLSDNPTNNQTNLFIKIESPETITYNLSNILINITSEGTLTWFNLGNGNNETFNNSLIKNVSDGQHTIYAFTKNIFGNVNSTAVTFIVNTTILNAPQNNTAILDSISNLSVSGITNTSITWSWNNPLSVNFSKAIVFFDGLNSLNTSSESFQAIGLVPNTTHTVTIWTVDSSGNINNTNVSNDAITLSSNSSGANDTTGNGGKTPEEDYNPSNSDNEIKSDSKTNFVDLLFTPLKINDKISDGNQSKEIILETKNRENKVDFNGNLIIILFLITLSLIVSIILVYVIRR